MSVDESSDEANPHESCSRIRAIRVNPNYEQRGNLAYDDYHPRWCCGATWFECRGIF
jgi:hypothetical protein